GKLKWWQIALISVAVSFLGRLSGGNFSREKQKKQYRNQEQAPWAPPGWVFGPAWVINNFFLLSGLKWVLENRSIPDKKKFLWIQAGIWAIFFSFNWFYFKKKSTVMAAILTKSDAVLALTAFLILKNKNKKIALTHLPLLIWTIYASSVADYQALKNPDPFLKTKALL